jgi:GNAT superfamily N-acetyltransferase
MPVIELSSTGRDDDVLDLFRELALRVYETDPIWAPASEDVIDECIARAASGEIEIRAVVATNGDHPVARAMAIASPAAADGWVGLFECLPESERAGEAVLNGCVDWLNGTGKQSVVGPRVDELRAGLLIEGFDRPHTIFTAYNPSFYVDVFRSAGFVVASRLVSFEFTRDRAPTFRQLPLGAVGLRSPDPSHIIDDLVRIEAFQDSVFGAGPGRVRRSRGASRDLARRLLPLLDLDLVVLAEDRAGQIVGVLVCVPDHWQPQPVDRARLVSVGVAPGWRGKRVAMAMGATLVARLLAKGYQTLEGSWVRADNTRPQALARALGGAPGRVFALLERVS